MQPPPVAPSVCNPAVARQTIEHFLEYAAMVEDLGFDWISISEHHSTPLTLSSSIMPLAGALTQVTRRMRIALFGPLAPISNPLRTAEEIAVLDQLSNGRVIVLPLRGTPSEFNTYAPVDATRTRSMTQEASRLIRKALCEPEPFAWDGDNYQFPNVAIWPRTIQRPYPPMYFSGNSSDSAVFAAREHFGVCFSFYLADVVAERIRLYRAEAAQAGWEPSPDEIVYRGFAIIADTDDKATEIESTFLVPARRFLLRSPVPGADDVFGAGESSGSDNGATAHGIGRMMLCGSPDTVVKQIEQFQAATGVGVIDIMFSAGQTPPADVRRSIELFGLEVLPRVRNIGSPMIASTP
jgi:alkanesulfonate monooxygenase SsuD/methylene tetrahydromethanopterin reductase-like flavin-dependent oxidoreductase (luciferase family)